MEAAVTPGGEPSFKDRGGRLVLFGLITVLLGIGALFVGLLSLALPFLVDFIPGVAGASQDFSTALMGFMTYAMIAGALIWTGVGSVRKRRWVPATMLVLAWSWLLLGACTIPLAVLLLDEILLLVGSGAGSLPPEIEAALSVVLLGLLSVGGVLLPALYLWVFRDPQVQRTCERHDPRPTWSDRCPRQVLGLSMVLWAAAVLTVPMALRPAVPLFGVLLSGIWGASVTLAGAGVTALLALGIYRRSLTAWWATTTLLILLGLSVAITAERVDLAELLGAMGYPEDPMVDMAMPGSVVRLAGVWSSVALTLLSVLYMVAIRRHFVAAREAGDQT